MSKLQLETLACLKSPSSVSCLYKLSELKQLAQGYRLELSLDTEKFLSYLVLKKLGVLTTQKLVKQIVESKKGIWSEDYEVEYILDYLKEDEKEIYLIKWKGWSNAYNSWEPKENILCEEVIQQFHNGDKFPHDEPPTKKRHLEKQELVHLIHNQGISSELLSMADSRDKVDLRSKSCSTMHSCTALTPTTHKNSKQYKERRQVQLKQLHDWQTSINQQLKDQAPIHVENNVDLEGPPESFTYTNDYLPMTGITIHDDPVVGCECGENCADKKSKCCGPSAGAQFAYYKNKRVKVMPGNPIYECNKVCKCSADCSNRVVQQGRKYKVCIFRTSNGRGWGVKAQQRIPTGAFVMEYVGEVISFEEAERRGQEYDREGMTYLFDLDYNDGDCPFTVDARFYGNVAHFVNHSCDPNLSVYGVWINTLDPRLPRIAMFANREIKKDEELTFDYLMTGVIEENKEAAVNPLDHDDSLISSDQVRTFASPKKLSFKQADQTTNPHVPNNNKTLTTMPRFMCHCGASNCKKYLF